MLNPLKSLIFIVLLALIPHTVNGQTTSDCQTPLRYRLINKNPILQQSLIFRLRLAKFDKYLKKNRLAISLVDLSHRKRHIYYAGINDNLMLYAASLPKIAILLTVFDALDRGHIQWTSELAQQLGKMITISSNPAANWAVRQVSLQRIAAVMQSPSYCFYEPSQGGLWMGKLYGKNKHAVREPIKNLSHAATTRQVARFYTMLAEGRLISSYWNQKMLDLMSPPGHNHKFVGSLRPMHGLSFVARKSGTWRNYHSDSALIQHFSNNYIIVALADIPGGGQVLAKIATIAAAIIKEGQHRNGSL